jgi:hypothetical protein
MPFGEYSRKWQSPANRPRRPTQHHRAVGVFIVGLLFVLILLVLLLNGCPIIPR